MVVLSIMIVTALRGIGEPPENLALVSGCRWSYKCLIHHREYFLRRHMLAAVLWKEAGRDHVPQSVNAIDDALYIRWKRLHTLDHIHFRDCECLVQKEVI